MNEDFIRIAPKPADRPTQVGSIFSPQLNLTPEKTRQKYISKPSLPKIPVFVENHELSKPYQSLVQPALNSSARLGKKLQDLESTKFDATTAIAEEFQNSEVRRTNFAEKVATAVNIKRDKNKYTDLVSLDVVPRDVISSHAQQRAVCKVKSSKIPDNEPQIMDFFSKEFEEETAKFEFDELEEEMPMPTVSYDYAFDLHSHMSCWEHTWK